MKGYAIDIEQATIQNSDYRRALYTGHYIQLVVMNLKPGEEIGEEVHGGDQFIRVEKGRAKAILNAGSTQYELEEEWMLIIPAGVSHNILNIGDSELKLYTLYAPPQHLSNVVHSSKLDEREDHFDGNTSE